jgi:hypothetical protein
LEDENSKTFCAPPTVRFLSIAGIILHCREPPQWARAQNRFAMARFAGGSGAIAVTGGENFGSGRRALVLRFEVFELTDDY